MEKSKIQKEYEDRRNYVQSLNLYDETKKNNEYYRGKQYNGKRLPREYPKSVMNLVRRITDFKVSSIMAEDVKFNYDAEGVIEDSTNRQMYDQATEIFNALAEKTADELDSKDVHEKVLKKSCLGGSAVAHYYWDNSIVKGNEVKSIGDIAVDIVPIVNVYPANPNIQTIQNQRDIIISVRMLVKDIIQEAEENNVPKDDLSKIVKDSDTQYTDSNIAASEYSNGEEKATVLVKYYKKDNRVMLVKECNGVVIKPETNTGLKLYPIAKMDWLDIDSTFYGGSEITEIIPSQDIINTMIASTAVSVQKTAFPKAFYDNTRIAGFSSAIGVSVGIKGDVSGAVTYPEVGTVSSDVWNIIEAVSNMTKDMLGANEAAMGEARAENTSALLTQIKQASVPIESIKRRYFKYLKHTGEIWADFWASKYNTGRLIKIPAKNEFEQDNEVTFTGTNFSNITFNVKVDIGGASAWSEPLELQMLQELRAAGAITDIEFFERIPNYMISKKQQLIDSRKQQQEQMDQENSQMMQFMAQLPPQVQAQLNQMPPEQRDNEIRAMMQMAQ